MYLPSSILTPADISQYIVVLLMSLSSPAITPDGKATVCTTNFSIIACNPSFCLGPKFI